MGWFLCVLLLLKIFLVRKGIMCMFGGWGKMFVSMFVICKYAF